MFLTTRFKRYLKRTIIEILQENESEKLELNYTCYCIKCGRKGFYTFVCSSSAVNVNKCINCKGDMVLNEKGEAQMKEHLKFMKVLIK